MSGEKANNQPPAYAKKGTVGLGKMTERVPDSQIRIEDLLETSKNLLSSQKLAALQQKKKEVNQLIIDSKKLLRETGKSTRAVKREHSKLPRSERTVHNGKGYAYVYAETGELILKARAILEKRIGRTLQDHERVLYRDGDRKNCAEDNLILAYKAGVPLDALTCSCCGARGQFIVEEKEI